MRTILRATVIAITWALAAPVETAEAKAGASMSDLQAAQAQMQTQMQALAERLNRLEADNTALKGEVAELTTVLGRREAEIDYLKSQTKELREESAVAANDLSKVKGADWASRIKLRGDLRVRTDRLESERVVGTGATAAVEDAADRDRPRFRARFGAEAQVTDNSKAVFELASGDGDPRSANQTFTNASSGKSVYINLAYADWAFAPGARLVLGKQKQPFWRTGLSLFFDADVNPEGAAVTYERGLFFGSAYAWMLQENYNSNPDGRNQDPHIFGGQAGIKLPLLGGETRLAAHYYDCGACQGNAPYWSGGNAYGNTTVADGSLQVLKYDYDVVILQAAVGTTVGGLPLQVWADWARNLAADVEYDTAYDVGVTLGRAVDRRTWEAGLAYQSMDKDAMFAQLIDSDFAAGNTDGEGWAIRFGYAPVKNVTLNALYMMTTTNKDVAQVSGPGYEIGRNLDYDRLQLDVNYRF